MQRAPRRGPRAAMGLQGQPDVAAPDAMAGGRLLVKVLGVEVPGVEQFQNLRHLVRVGPARRDPAQATVIQPSLRLVAPAPEGALRNALRRLALAQHHGGDRIPRTSSVPVVVPSAATFFGLEAF